MRKILGFIVAAAAILIFASPVHANVDQKCVSDCVTGSKAAASCVQSCTYGMPTKHSHAQPSPGTDVGSNHKVLTAPVPVNGVILDTQVPKKKDASKDYICINNCQKDGWQYQMCQARCQKTQCGLGITPCKDLTGRTLAPVPVQPPPPSPIAAPYSK